MDLLGKLIAGLFARWLLALAIGLVISLMPIVLFALGFVLMIGFLTLLGRLFRF